MFFKMLRRLLPSQRRISTCLTFTSRSTLQLIITSPTSMSFNGANIYMSITCRPDITFTIGKTSRGMHQPTPAHVAALNHLISYMWKTRDFKFRYFPSGCSVRSHLRGITAQDASISFYAGSDGQQTDSAVGFAGANFAHVSDEQRTSIRAIVSLCSLLDLLAFQASDCHCTVNSRS